MAYLQQNKETVTPARLTPENNVVMSIDQTEKDHECGFTI